MTSCVECGSPIFPKRNARADPKFCGNRCYTNNYRRNKRHIPTGVCQVMENQEWLPMNEYNWNTLINKINEIIDEINEIKQQFKEVKE